MLALRRAGRAEAAVRQTLYRMVRDGELEASRAGRAKLYAPTEYAKAEIAVGTRRILAPEPWQWDGQWTLIVLRPSGRVRDRVTQARIESLLKVEDCAPLGALARRYNTVLQRLQRLTRELDRRDCSDEDAFLLRFAVVFAYRSVAWDDPELPARVLPPDWPGAAARAAAAALYRRLLPGATRQGDALLRATGQRCDTGQGNERLAGASGAARPHRAR